MYSVSKCNQIPYVVSYSLSFFRTTCIYSSVQRLNGSTQYITGSLLEYVLSIYNNKYMYTFVTMCATLCMYVCEY